MILITIDILFLSIPIIKNGIFFLVLLFLISILALISLVLIIFYIYNNAKELKNKIIDDIMVLTTIHFNLIYCWFLFNFPAFKNSLFPQGSIYFKGEYCYFLRENFSNGLKIYQIPGKEGVAKKIWCRLKNVIIFWKDSQNIYVHLETNKGEYNFPIKREFILQEPLIMKEVLKVAASKNLPENRTNLKK